jgi:citrate lyase subunit beta/citryl-CoA lyase
MKSLLFAPGNSSRKMAKALESGADAVILDLEDSVGEADKAAARHQVAEILAGPRPCKVLVRVNPLLSSLALHDLASVVAHAPDAIVLPKPDSAADVVRLGLYLEALEAQAGLQVGSLGILPIATETPAALFNLQTYADHRQRLVGLTWGAEDLPTALGATTNRGERGGYSDVCRLARSLCLAGAAAAQVGAFETVYPDFNDVTGLDAYAQRGRAEGFVGMMAIHPRQVAIINHAFTPTPDEVARARTIVALFETTPGAGVLSLDGKMLDRPHLDQARRVLARVDDPGSRP